MTNAHSPKITAYSTGDYPELHFSIVPATARREWMNNFFNGHPYRCLPLTMANQLGWFICNPVGFVAEWPDENIDTPVTVKFDEKLSVESRSFIGSYFGNGVITWHIPYLFQTSPGYNLLVRGPANAPKDGIQALEGMTETDWAEVTFTMNWKFTRAKHQVRFEKDEPFCMILPIQRGMLEQFEANVDKLENNPDLNWRYQDWHRKRQQLKDEAFWRKRIALALNHPFTPSYQLDYFRGRSVNGKLTFGEHQTHISLKSFKMENNQTVSSSPDGPVQFDLPEQE